MPIVGHAHALRVSMAPGALLGMLMLRVSMAPGALLGMLMLRVSMAPGTRIAWPKPSWQVGG